MKLVEFKKWDELLIESERWGKLSERSLQQIFKNALIKSWIKKQATFHSLRHSFATLLYSKHHDLVLVQEALGHADINTSRIYTHFDTSRLKKTTDLM